MPRTRSALLVVLVAAVPVLSPARPTITSVKPTGGSLNGGTRVHIQGTGFSANTGGTGNVITIGDYFCDPIPLHCTTQQIACKTRSPLLSTPRDAHSSRQQWSHRTTAYLSVRVTVDGQVSECTGTCEFRFTAAWYHTPRTYGLWPVVVHEGTLLQVRGHFHAKPFEFDELKAPSMEIPLASVKIANRAPEKNRPENEPFGQSGTRCALFNQESEEPYSVTAVGNRVDAFSCQVNGPRDAGRYNLSVALLGTGMANEWKMYFGEAEVAEDAFQADHQGVSFMLHHVALVTSITPTSSGVLGGARLTISGTGFTHDKTIVRVHVGGDACHVELATMTRIECVLAPHDADKTRVNSTGTGSAGGVKAGSRGVRRRLWFGAGATNIESFRASPAFLSPDLQQIEMGLVESPINLQSERGDAHGPHGQYDGFFRAPVSGNYTFIISADDDARLWVGTQTNTAEPKELIISFNGWYPSRRFDREAWYRGGRYSDPLDKLNHGLAQRASRQVHLHQGDFLYFDAHYRSNVGGDNFALGVIQHNSTVNRKDAVAAYDEKQLIDIVLPRPNFEVQKVTVQGVGLSGTFKLLLGDKVSRQIAVDANESHVSAAVRELLSDCQGDIGLPDDSAGNTFECYSGRGLDYRGLAHVTEDGEECLAWRDTAHSDPFLATAFGLDGNLCRNPDYHVSRGPWCYNAQGAKRSCRVPRCGGNHVRQAPLVASFEDEGETTEDLPFTAVSQERDGTVPKIVEDTAFCGSGALFMNNGWGMFKNGVWRTDEAKDPAFPGADPGMYPFGTHKFPYMCMAYRIPPTSKVSMLILVRGRDVDGNPQDAKDWRTIELTNTQHHFLKIGDWNAIADDRWHHGCLNLQYLLDSSADSGNDNLVFAGQDHLVYDVIFWTHGQAVEYWAKNPFWIDEFSISQRPRAVRQTSLPKIPRRISDSRVRLVQVVKEELVDAQAVATRSWSIHLTSDDCSAPSAAFTIDVRGITGSLDLAEVDQVQDHSPQIEGNVEVDVSGHKVTFTPYSNASTVKAAFQESGAVGPGVKVMRTGTCQSGFGWLVTMTHAPGDLPLMTASLTTTVATSASVHVYPYVDGGHLMAPLSVDYAHEPVNDTTVQVLVDESVADCVRGGNLKDMIRTCGIDGRSPCVTKMSSVYGSFSADRAIDGGFGTFIHTDCNKPNEWWMIDLGVPVSIESIKIYNRIEGHYRLQGAGVRVGNSTEFHENPECASGLGFGPVIDTPCLATGRYVFVVQPRADSCLHFMEIQVFSKIRFPENISRCVFDFDDSLTPTVSYLDAGRTSTGTYSLTITGRGFADGAAGIPSVIVVSRMDHPNAMSAVVTNVSDTTIQCQTSFPFVAAGNHALSVVVPGKGAARGNISLTYQLEIESITPQRVKRALVQTVTINGAGFNPVLSANILTIDGTRCEPIKVSPRQLLCSLGPAANISTSRRRNLLSTLDLQLSLVNGPSITDSSLLLDSANVPTITGVVPSIGAAGGGYAVTVAGSAFALNKFDNTVMLGSTPCTVTFVNATEIRCTAGNAPVGSGKVMVIVEGQGVSDASLAPLFTYQLSVSQVRPNVLGFGGETEASIIGQGFLSGANGNETVTPVLAIAGLETFVLGLYSTTAGREVQELVLNGKFVSEIQRVAIPTSNYFALAIFDGRTELLSKNVSHQKLQTALSKLMPAFSQSVLVMPLPQHASWQVEFPADLGDVPLLSGFTCDTEDATDDACSAGAMTATELVPGVAPTGTFQVQIGPFLSASNASTLSDANATNSSGNQTTNTSRQVPNSQMGIAETAWRHTINISLNVSVQRALTEAWSQITSANSSESIRVVKRPPSSDELVWEVTFLDLYKSRSLMHVDDTQVVGGNVSVRRKQVGVSPPTGTFQLHLNGHVTEELPVDASAGQVEQAIKSAFPHLLSASVFTVDLLSGQFQDRLYPRQWMIKIERPDIVAAGIERCTSPLYIDWDPDACPTTAPDLFLHHFPWYWPVGLPKPQDIGEDDTKAVLQARCDSEARALQFRPVTCQALLPLESLPLCGEGSGINPPCWAERFSRAQVRHSDGQDVEYTRDDSRTPSDTVKGYRFWTRTDFLALQNAQSLSVNHSVSFPDGMHVSLQYVRAQEFVECSVVTANSTHLKAVVPSLTSHATSVSNLVQSDAWLKPAAHFSFNHPAVDAREDSGVDFEAGVGFSGNGGSAHFRSAFTVSYDIMLNTFEFTLEIWVRVTRFSSGYAPLWQNLGADEFSGYALALSDTGRWQFYLAVGGDSRAGVEMPIRGFSVVTGTAAVDGAWSIVGLTFDGVRQSIFVNGELQGSEIVAGPYRWNADSDAVFAGPCGNWLGQPTPGCSPDAVLFRVDEALFYPRALSASILKLHARSIDLTVHAAFKVKTQHVFGESSASPVRIQIASTPRVWSVHPLEGYDGTQITIDGRGFYTVEGVSAVKLVKLGSGTCDSIMVLSDTRLTCTARGPAADGLVQVVADKLGASLSSSTFSWISVIESISPSAGSLLGGTLLTIGGVGLGSNSTDLLLTTVASAPLSVKVGSAPCLVLSASGHALVCRVAQRTRPTTAESQSLQVVLMVADKAAQCNVSAGCALTQTETATPVINFVHPLSVIEGDLLSIWGDSLPTIDNVSVTLGASLCSVMERNATSIVCRVNLGVGGRQRLAILFTVGYAGSISHDLAVTYEASVSQLNASHGSRWGGQAVAITGTGFAALNDTTTQSRTKVFIGQRQARVLGVRHSEVIFETPALSDKPAIGIEREHVWKRIRHCASYDASQADCRGRELVNCSISLSWGVLASPAGASSNNRILALPGSDERSFADSLVDGDKFTVWWSKPHSKSLQLIIDLGVPHDVSDILVYWAGKGTAQRMKVSASALSPSAANCMAGTKFWEEIVPWHTTMAALNDVDHLRDLVEMTHPSFRKEGDNAMKLVHVFDDVAPALRSASPNLWYHLYHEGADSGHSYSLRWMLAIPSGKFVRMSCHVKFHSASLIHDVEWSFQMQGTPKRCHVGECKVHHGLNFTAGTWLEISAIAPSYVLGDGRKVFSPYAGGENIFEFKVDSSGISNVDIKIGGLAVEVFDTLQAAEGARLPYTAMSQADAVEALNLGDFSFIPRVFMIEFEGLHSDMVSFGIRDLVFVADDQLVLPFPSRQPVLVEVGGVEAQCATVIHLNASVCSFNYSSAPTVLHVTPANGTAGTLLTVAVTDFHVSDCGLSNVSIGGSQCEVHNCSAGDNVGFGWISCVVGRMSAGIHEIALTVAGQPAHSNDVSFTYPLSIASVTPATGGYGGGYEITIAGDGFSIDTSRITATLCDVPCTVTASGMASLICTPAALQDSPLVPEQSWLDLIIADPDDDATEDLASKAIVVSSAHLSPYLQHDDMSHRQAFLRFRGVDIPQGTRVGTAQLQVRAADGSCLKNGVIRIWAEAADDSAPFDPSFRGSLGLRPKTSRYHDWKITERWRWAESKESLDLSDVINEVLLRPGWRAGNSITLVLSQTFGSFACSIMSADYSLKYAPRLRLSGFNRTADDSTQRTCVVGVSVKSDQSKLDETSKCARSRARITATASSSDEVSDPSQLQPDTGNGFVQPNLFRRVLHKKSSVLTFEEARMSCASIGSRLCRSDFKGQEIFVPADGTETFVEFEGKKFKPFFGFQERIDPDSPIFVPVESLWHGARPDASRPNTWLQVSPGTCHGDGTCTLVSDDTEAPWWGMHDKNAQYGANGLIFRAQNENRTNIIPCCGLTGNPAYMAVDQELETYWDSGLTPAANLTLAFKIDDVHSLDSVDIIWTQDYAIKYHIFVSCDAEHWQLVAGTEFGDGDFDTVSIQSWKLELCDPAENLYLRIDMRQAAAGSERYGVKEVIVHTCIHRSQLTSVAATMNQTHEPLFTAIKAQTPQVTSVVPERGSTAGGTDLTITGRFFSSDKAAIAVGLGPFDCQVKSVTTLSSSGLQQIVCVSSASGILFGGKKYVTVSSAGHGASLGSDNATFWYVDTWSSRTTWGGKAPPTGCGSWEHDLDCTDTVVIPKGQVVLLDVSLPRFYLILIEGSLIFDRKDLSLSASYILLRGGTLQIGTEQEPFLQHVQITLYGHPKSMELPTFGSKVIACYECIMDIHGRPQVAWTQLAATAVPGATEIILQDPVSWPVNSKIVIATTDFESPISSHSEVATVAGVVDDGKRVQLKDIRVCSQYALNGLPFDCTHSQALKYTHLGEVKVFDGHAVPFRAEVGLLSRNIVIQGDHDDVLCPLADIADDGITKLSCNQFGAQIFFHSPGHESLVARISNFEIRNAGQAFRLGRYAIHWHMVGNLRQSFQRNISTHHSWNRGVAIHGINYLRLQSNFAYKIMGHTFFIEDGVEEFNRLENNLVIKTIPSMSLLNTDQTPACFWIVTGANYIINNHGVASRRYGMWLRPEISATGTSINTPMDVHPINIPILEHRGNQMHSNGKYGFRIFDNFFPNKPSVIQDLFVWRNGKSGWTATSVGQVGFDGVISVQNVEHVFEARATFTDSGWSEQSWDLNFIMNGLFVDVPISDDGIKLALGDSWVMAPHGEHSFQTKKLIRESGPPQTLGMALPWNDAAGRGLTISNCTFVNFVNGCLMGCAHCGKGGSPSIGDGGYETRFRKMRFVNSPQRVLFRHPNEAFFYDLDGSLTETGPYVEDWTSGGNVKGNSFVGTSVLLPPDKCAQSSFSTAGTGGSVCTGLTFRRMWYHIRSPSSWIGKALCVRPAWDADTDTCQNFQPQCNCLPYLKKGERGQVWLVADGYRYNMQQDFKVHELSDPQIWDMNVKDVLAREEFHFTQRMLQWRDADAFGRPLFNIENRWPSNFFTNTSACNEDVSICNDDMTCRSDDADCGKFTAHSNWEAQSNGRLEYDAMGTYMSGVGLGGDVPLLTGAANGDYTVKIDEDGNGALLTMYRHNIAGANPRHRHNRVQVQVCPPSGCWPPPKMDDTTSEFAGEFALWSSPETWYATTNSTDNPLNSLEEDPDLSSFGSILYRFKEQQAWAAPTPSEFDNVWIPKGRRVVLDVNPPILNRLVIEGMLIINGTDKHSIANLTATWIEIKGGSLIIAKCDSDGNVTGPFEGQATLTLLGTNSKLASLHGDNPRETPDIYLGKQGLRMGAGSLGVMGSFVAKGRAVSHSYVALSKTAEQGETSLEVQVNVSWIPGDEIVITPTDHDMHAAEVRTITAVTPTILGTTITFAEPLNHRHVAQNLTYGKHSMVMMSRVGLLTRNVVIRGDGEGEDLPYAIWNSQRASDSASSQCGNGLCENGEHSKICSADCRGPAYEFGASILVAAYDEEYISCRQGSLQCYTGYERLFVGQLDLEHVEIRYYGQNNLRAGLEIKHLGQGGKNVRLSHVSMNRGYFGAIDIQNSSGVTIDSNVIYRSHLPTVYIRSDSFHNLISNNLAVVAILWDSHRGAQSKFMDDFKWFRGMFANRGHFGNKFLYNIAAGSERAGFTGNGVDCGDHSSFAGNEAHSSLAGYWYDYHVPGRTCSQVHDLTAWKMWEYGIYGETKSYGQIEITEAKLADCRVGLWVHFIGSDLAENKVIVTDSLVVGHSENADCMSTKRPSLHSCAHKFAWCNHLGPNYVGIVIPAFQASQNHAPHIAPWNDIGGLPTIFGQTEVDGLTLANFGLPCLSGPRGNIRDVAVATFKMPDNCPPMLTKNVVLINVDSASKTQLSDPDPSWINQADCVDMDCDGMKQCLISDLDGSFSGLGAGRGSVFSRAEKFSEGSFFGRPFADPINKQHMESNYVPSWIGQVNVSFSGQHVAWGKEIWYPNVPAVMWGDRLGRSLEMSQSWLQKGFGISRDACALMPGWNAWGCPDNATYSKLVIENRDADRMIRRISPVAITSDGYTNLLNGCMDHGWCQSYTCLERLMTFWAVVKLSTTHVVHFTGSNPQTMRLHLHHVDSCEKIIVKIYYQTSMRLQIFRGEEQKFIEDMNRLDGKSKEQLVLDGRLAPNNADGGYTRQLVDLNSPCNDHGANTFDREQNMLEILVAGHSAKDFLEIRSMPVVQVSMGVSTSVADFYKIKDTFLSSLAMTLGIDLQRITIVDVVAGNARRRRNLLSTSTIVNFEVEPDPEIELQTTSVTVLEDVAVIAIRVKRSVNIIGECGVAYSFSNQTVSTAVPGVNFVTKTGFITFASTEVMKEISVEILSQAEFRAEDVHFVLTIFDAVNATLGETQQAVILLRNVHRPAPAAPFMAGSGTTKTTLGIGWSDVPWLAPPNLNATYNVTLEWALQCRTPDSSPADFRSVIVPFADSTSVVWGGLSSYTRVQCRLRVRSGGGWSGWSDVSADMYTHPTCGDGSRQGVEQCDDGDTTSGDGCSSGCVVESGFACVLRDGVDVCSNGCGNGTREASEACDDHNSVGNDGCDAKCEIETGWSCYDYNHSTITATISVCAVNYGDGFRLPGWEECDDGNNQALDGCSSGGKIEDGFSCADDASGKSVCQKCGNGIREGTEVCDDGRQSGACIGCGSIRSGWSCSAAGTICAVGPDRVATPMLLGPQDTSLQARWWAPDGHGLSISTYQVQWLNASLSDWSAAATATVLSQGLTLISYTIHNLTVSTFYKVRVRGCNAEGCTSVFSAESGSVSTLAKIVKMTEIGDKAGDAVAAAASSSNFSVSNMTVATPPPPPEAPPPKPELNLTLVSQLQAQMLAISMAQSGVTQLGLTAGFSKEQADVQVSEGAGKVELQVQLLRLSDASADHEGSTTATVLTWAIVSDTVTAPTDVITSEGNVIFFPGDVNRTLSIDVVDNRDLNYGRVDKQMVVRLTRVQGEVSLSTTLSEVTVTIIDNEPTPTVWMASMRAYVTVNNHSIAQDLSVVAGSMANLTVYRSGWMLGALKLKLKGEAVSFAEVDFQAERLAKPGEDFPSTSVEAVFAAGVNETLISFPTHDAGRKESVEFRVVLESVQSECVAGDGAFLCSGLVKTDSNKPQIIMTPAPQVITPAPAPVPSPGKLAVCGDALRDVGEACDDGNVYSEDGCSDECDVEAGFMCQPVVEPSSLASTSSATDATITGVKDTCGPPEKPPAGQVFLRAEAELVGVNAEAFVGSVRRIFRQAIADSVSPPVSIDKVLIIGVVTLTARRAGSEPALAVEFQIQVAADDKEVVAQSIVDAAGSGALTRRLRDGGLDASVSAISPPEFVSGDGSRGMVKVEPYRQPLDIVTLAIATSGGLGVLLLSLCCCLNRKRLAACCWSETRKGKISIADSPSLSTISSDSKPLRQSASLEDGAARTLNDVNAASASGLSTANNMVFMGKMRQVLAPVWGRVVDAFFLFCEDKSRFVSKEQVMSVLSSVYDALDRKETSIDRVNQSDIERCLRLHAARTGGGLTEEGTDFLSLCETLAPDLLGRRVFQLFCALKVKSGKGACVAELQNALLLGSIPRDQVVATTGSQILPFPFPTTSPESERQRILFSDMFYAMQSSAPIDFEGPLNEDGSSLRGKLERDVQRACDALAATESLVNSGGTGGSLNPQLMKMKPLPATLASAASRIRTLNKATAAFASAGTHEGEKLFLSKFRAPLAPAEDDQDKRGAGAPFNKPDLPPISRPLVPQAPSAPAEDDASDEVDEEAPGLLPGSATSEQNLTEAARGQSHAALRRGESVIRKQMIESHEQELLRHQDAHQVEIVRREEELQRQLRMRQEKRGSAQLEVAGARSTTPRAPRGSRPELQHRPSVMERKQMIEDHEQALQREQSAQQDKILRAEEELHRQLRERQERRANRPGSAAQREPTA